MSRTALVILNWNSWADTVECLASVIQSRADDYRIVLIDNGSRDDSVEQILAWANGGAAAPSPFFASTITMSPVTVIAYDRVAAEAGGTGIGEACLGRTPARQQLVMVCLDENLGFAGGSNVGLRYAMNAGFDYALLLNNDTVVDAGALSALAMLLDAQPAIDAVTGQIRYYRQPDRIWNCGGDLAWYGAPRYAYAGVLAATAPTSGWSRITFATGCALMLRCSALRGGGLLTERFFHGEEDFELAMRFQRQGRLIACCYDAVIFHKVNSSIRKTAGHSYLRQTYIHYLSRFIDMRSQWPRPVWKIWRWCYTTYILVALLMRRRTSGREAIQFGKGLLRDSAELDAVDKRTFERVLSTQAWLF